jgi:hypothetical protein
MRAEELGLMALIMLATTTAHRRGTSPARAGVRWSDREMRLFADEVSSIGVPPEAALLVYTAESGLDPAASSGPAYGIPQLTKETAKDIGWTSRIAEFGKLSVAEQIPWIGRLLAYQARSIGHVPKDSTDLYVANFCPRAARTNDDVLYRRGSVAYEKNMQLDRDRKGFISRSDLAESLRRAEQSGTYRAAVAQLRRVLEATKP